MSKFKSIDIVLPLYNGRDYICKSLDSLIKQKNITDILINIIVVNDCSKDDGAKIIEQHYKDIQLINLHENVGRSKARNIGAISGTSELIFFMDSDCVLTDKILLPSIINYFDLGYEFCFGRIDSKSSEFWGQYLKNIAHKRHSLAQINSYLSFTSQIFTMKRSTFENIQGFNENYVQYGFEDRDLFLRVQKSNAKILYVPDLIATTIDSVSLDDVCTKMELSSRYSAKIFYADHPNEYKNMVYGKIDSRIHPIITSPIKLFNKLFLSIFKTSGNYLLRQKFCPYIIKHMVVKMLTALYYVKGTY